MTTQPRRTGALWLVVSLFFAYVAVGYVWAIQTKALVEPDILYHADAPRVVWNETSTAHVHGRVVLHPLHVLLTAPIGIPLTALLGSRHLAAVVVTALFAAGSVFVLDALLRRCTSLPTLERLLFVLLLGFSAGHFIFASIPETHVISVFFLALTTWALARTQADRVHLPTLGAGEWKRWLGGGLPFAMVFAAGALVTNALLVPVSILLRFSDRVRLFRRLRSVVLLSCAIVAMLGGLYLVQRVLFFRSAGPAVTNSSAEATKPGDDPNAGIYPTASSVPPANVEPVRSPPKRAGAVGWLRERFDRELRYVAWSPKRAVEVGLATLVFNLYTPRSERYTLAPNPEPQAAPPSKFPAVRLDYLAFDMRAPGLVGALAWIAVASLAFAMLARRRDRAEFLGPVVGFVSAWIGLFFVIANLYHVYPIDPENGPNDTFLFAPNLILPVLLLVALAYSRAILPASQRIRWFARAGLAVAVLAAAVNTGMHLQELFELYLPLS